MFRYIPVSKELPYSTLWKEEPHVRVLFLTLMALADKDHVARVPDYQLPGRANLTDPQVREGLEVLSSPDTRTSFPQPHDGRRIERHPEGWLLLNGEKYQQLMREANNRAKWNRQKQAQRERLKLANGKPLPGEVAYVAKVEQHGPEPIDPGEAWPEGGA